MPRCSLTGSGGALPTTVSVDRVQSPAVPRRTATILAAVALIAAACSGGDEGADPTTATTADASPPTTTAPPTGDEPASLDLAAVLPSGVELDGEGGELQVRWWDTARPGDLGPAEVRSGSLPVRLPSPDQPVRERELASTGTAPYDRPLVGHVAIDGAEAKAIVTPDGELAGMLVAGPGVAAVVLDVDGDDDADVVDALRFDPPGRLLVLTPEGQAYDRGLAAGTPACPGTGRGDPLDPRIRLVLACGGGGEGAGDALGPVGAARGTAAGRGVRVQEGVVDIVISGREAADALGGAGAPPSAEARADADRLLADLERHGAAVVAGALVNEALTAVVPDEVAEVLGWLGEATGLADDLEDDDLARQVTRSPDDLLSGATIEILDLGRADGDEADDDAGDEPSGTGGSDGLCTSDRANADGSCADDEGSGSSSGDPHLRTYDGLLYDLQAVGELVLTRAPGLEVHVRYEPWFDSDRVSVTTAVGARIGGATVTVDHRREGVSAIEVAVDGDPIDTGTTVDLPDGGELVRGRTEVLATAGDGSTLGVDLRPGFLNVRVRPADGLVPEGLLGDRDGDPADDLATPDGPLDATAPTADDLYGRFAEAWRVTDATSLLPYRGGETTATFTDRSFPAAPATLDDVSVARAIAARILCREAGVVAGDALGACVLDVALTGDEDFARGAARLAGPPERDPLAQRLRDPDRWVSVRPGGWADEVVEAPGADDDPTRALGARDASGVQIGAGDETCAAPFVVRFTDVALLDDPGPDLAVFQLGVGEQEYEVWVGEPGDWRRVGRGAGPAAFDLRGVLTPGETADHVRICDPPDGVEGPDRSGAPGPSIDAVAVLGTPLPVIAR